MAAVDLRQKCTVSKTALTQFKAFFYQFNEDNGEIKEIKERKNKIEGNVDNFNDIQCAIAASEGHVENDEFSAEFGNFDLILLLWELRIEYL